MSDRPDRSNNPYPEQGNPLTQALWLLDNEGFYREADALERWIEREYARLSAASTEPG